MTYSIVGLRNGLKAVMQDVQNSMFQVAWRSFIYDTFREYTDYKKRSIFTRRRDLALAMPINQEFHVGQLVANDTKLLLAYANLGKRSMKDDMQVVVSLGLADQVGDHNYIALTGVLHAMKSPSVDRQK